MLRRTLLAVIFLVAVSDFAAQTDEIETAYKALQTADAGKDFDGVLRAADSCFQLSNALIRAPQPADQDKVEAWKNAAVYAKQVRAYAEYTVNIATLRIRPECHRESSETRKMWCWYSRTGYYERSSTLLPQASE